MRSIVADTNIWLAIATVLGTGVVSAYLTQRLIRSRDEAAIKRQKLEELYFSVHKLVEVSVDRILPWLDLAEDKRTFNDAQMRALEAERERDEYDTAKMLVNVYFPSLEQDLADTLLKAHEMKTAVHLFRAKLQSGKDYSQEGNNIRGKINALQLQEAHFHELLFEEASHIGRNRIFASIRLWLRRKSRSKRWRRKLEEESRIEGRRQ